MISPTIIRFIFLLLLLIAGLAALSQPTQPMVWFEAVECAQENGNFSTTLLFQRRVFLEKEHTYQHIYWASGNYKLDARFSVGGGLIYVAYQKEVDEGYATVPEIRPFQYLTFTQKLGNTKWTLRNMVEERYMSSVMQNEIQKTSKFNMRYRFRLKGLIPISNRLGLELSNEVLFNGKQLPVKVFSQNRAVARLRYMLGNWSINGGVMHWLVNSSTASEHRPALLVGFSHKF